MPEITVGLVQVHSHWTVYDIPCMPGTFSIGKASDFADDLAAKQAADHAIRDVLAAERFRITAGPVWSKSAGPGYLARLTYELELYSYRVDRLPPLHAARALVTEGGALVFLNSEGQAIKGFSPTGWASFSMEDPPA